jgi:hypothetical protein
MKGGGVKVFLPPFMRIDSPGFIGQMANKGRAPMTLRMTLVTFLLMVVFFSLPSIAHAGGIPPDKASHFAGGVVAGGAGTAIANLFIPEHRLLVGTLLGTIPGLAIEIGDSTNDAGFSIGDLVADFLGSAVGALITDKLILKPVVQTGSEKRVSLEIGRNF